VEHKYGSTQLIELSKNYSVWVHYVEREEAGTTAEKCLASGVFVAQKLGLPHCSRWSHWGEDNRKQLLERYISNQ
jgi:hypothetical protein